MTRIAPLLSIEARGRGSVKEPAFLRRRDRVCIALHPLGFHVTQRPVRSAMPLHTSRDVVAILGAGSIGTAWAILFAQGGCKIRLHDSDEERLREAPDEIRARLADLEACGLLAETSETVLARIALVTDLGEAVRGTDHVQECIPENLDLKTTLFARLDELAARGTVLASSSSFIPASQFAERLAGRERCLVVHPGNPPYLLRVAEIVPAPWTTDVVVERTEALLRAAGVTPVRIRREIVGFVFNRLQGAVLREAYCLVRDGVASTDEIDRIVRDGLGLRWSVTGPFETAELNTRGGIEAHAERMGPAYHRMGGERGQDDPWTKELVASVAAERRKALALEEWGARVAWRDRALMALLRCRHDDPALQELGAKPARR